MPCFPAICDGVGLNCLFSFGDCLGVGHNPEAVPLVRRTKGGSGYTVPFRIKPERSEFPEHNFQSARAKGDDVFNEDVPRARFFNEAPVLAPKPGSVAGESGTASEQANVLAWEASANNVNWL